MNNIMNIILIDELKFISKQDEEDIKKYGIKVKTFKQFDAESLCIWEYFEGENHAECGKIFEFNSSNRNQLEFIHCPFCGGKIKDYDMGK